MKQPILAVRDLSYEYGNGEPALSGINVEIFKGEKIAVIGSNGAGKSTFFLCLNGVIQPQTGFVEYKGNKIDKKNLKELRKNVGLVFQDADNQIIASTVRAEVGFGPMNLKLTKEEVINRVEIALKYMNLSEFKNRPPHFLSGGEKKRVSIADIIAMDSEIMVFDEPTVSLDPLNAQMLEETLAKLESESKTLIISTHDVDFAYKWAERILVFSEGGIIADGSAAEIFLNTDILNRANLKKPIMLEVYEILEKKKLISKEHGYPKTSEDLKRRML